MAKTLLVVDDDVDIQSVVEELFENSDYKVVVANNGREALDQIEAGLKPDIMLLDLMMPYISGYTLLNEMYRRNMHTNFKIVVMSADVFTKQQMDQMGVKTFITKPFDIFELQKLIESL